MCDSFCLYCCPTLCLVQFVCENAALCCSVLKCERRQDRSLISAASFQWCGGWRESESEGERGRATGGTHKHIEHTLQADLFKLLPCPDEKCERSGIDVGFVLLGALPDSELDATCALTPPRPILRRPIQCCGVDAAAMFGSA